VTAPAFAPPAMERAQPQTCPVCSRSIDVVDAPSLRLTGRCVRCRLAEPAPTQELRIKDGPVARAFPAWTLSLEAIQRPAAREAHAGNYTSTEER